MNNNELLEKNKFIVLKQIIDKNKCNDLVKKTFEIYDNGNTIIDAQCSKSDSLYNNELFNSLHNSVSEYLGNYINKKIVPTFSYCRIYREGEILKKHVDRYRCEYASTITLGYESNEVWPIFFEDIVNNNNGNKINLEIGDLVFYKGEELTHWREEYKGNWQIQLCFFFVSEKTKKLF